MKTAKVTLKTNIEPQAPREDGRSVIWRNGSVLTEVRVFVCHLCSRGQEGHPPDAPIVAWWTKEVES